MLRSFNKIGNWAPNSLLFPFHGNRTSIRLFATSSSFDRLDVDGRKAKADGIRRLAASSTLSSLTLNEELLKLGHLSVAYGSSASSSSVTTSVSSSLPRMLTELLISPAHANVKDMLLLLDSLHAKEPLISTTLIRSVLVQGIDTCIKYDHMDSAMILYDQLNPQTLAAVRVGNIKRESKVTATVLSGAEAVAMFARAGLNVTSASLSNSMIPPSSAPSPAPVPLPADVQKLVQDMSQAGSMEEIVELSQQGCSENIIVGLPMPMSRGKEQEQEQLQLQSQVTVVRGAKSKDVLYTAGSTVSTATVGLDIQGLQRLIVGLSKAGNISALMRVAQSAPFLSEDILVLLAEPLVMSGHLHWFTEKILIPRYLLGYRANSSSSSSSSIRLNAEVPNLPSSLSVARVLRAVLHAKTRRHLGYSASTKDEKRGLVELMRALEAYHIKLLTPVTAHASVPAVVSAVSVSVPIEVGSELKTDVPSTLIPLSSMPILTPIPIPMGWALTHIDHIMSRTAGASVREIAMTSNAAASALSHSNEEDINKLVDMDVVGMNVNISTTADVNSQINYNNARLVIAEEDDDDVVENEDDEDGDEDEKENEESRKTSQLDPKSIFESLGHLPYLPSSFAARQLYELEKYIAETRLFGYDATATAIATARNSNEVKEASWLDPETPVITPESAFFLRILPAFERTCFPYLVEDRAGLGQGLGYPLIGHRERGLRIRDLTSEVAHMQPDQLLLYSTNTAPAAATRRKVSATGEAKGTEHRKNTAVSSPNHMSSTLPTPWALSFEQEVLSIHQHLQKWSASRLHRGLLGTVEGGRRELHCTHDPIDYYFRGVGTGSAVGVGAGVGIGGGSTKTSIHKRIDEGTEMGAADMDRVGGAMSLFDEGQIGQEEYEEDGFHADGDGDGDEEEEDYEIVIERVDGEDEEEDYDNDRSHEQDDDDDDDDDDDYDDDDDDDDEADEIVTLSLEDLSGLGLVEVEDSRFPVGGVGHVGAADRTGLGIGWGKDERGSGRLKGRGIGKGKTPNVVTVEFDVESDDADAGETTTCTLAISSDLHGDMNISSNGNGNDASIGVTSTTNLSSSRDDTFLSRKFSSAKGTGYVGYPLGMGMAMSSMGASARNGLYSLSAEQYLQAATAAENAGGTLYFDMESLGYNPPWREEIWKQQQDQQENGKGNGQQEVYGQNAVDLDDATPPNLLTTAPVSHQWGMEHELLSLTREEKTPRRKGKKEKIGSAYASAQPASLFFSDDFPIIQSDILAETRTSIAATATATDSEFPFPFPVMADIAEDMNTWN